MWNMKGGGVGGCMWVLGGYTSIIEVATRFIPRRKIETCEEVEMK